MEVELSTALTLGLASSTSTSNLRPLLDNLSTALVLWDPTWNYDTNPRKQLEANPAPPQNLPKVKTISAKRMNKNNDQVVPETQGRWKIQKRLAASDLGYCARLLIPIDSVRNHVLPYLGDKFVKRLESEAGFEVTIQDCDTNTSHRLIFKRWSSTKSYIFNGDWTGEFVHRRGLKAKDVIGLYWDPSKAVFMFSLLQRATSQ